jgi:TolB-like protein
MAVGVSALYFETDATDGFRESRFSKERRLEPQITVGPLAAQVGFPLMVSVFASTGDQLCTNVSQLRSIAVVAVGTRRSSCRRRSPCGGRSPWKPKKPRWVVAGAALRNAHRVRTE